jgi:hypothetical protein
MSRVTLFPLIVAAVFTLGCIGIHSARRHPDAVTVALLLLLGFVASVYVGQFTQLDAHHPAWQHEASKSWTEQLAYPMM